MKPWPLQLQEALAEVTQRTKHEIESETAWRWAARAVACVRMIEQTDGPLRVRWIAEAVQYGHEAIEHAASAGVEVLRAIQAQLASESPVLFGGGS